MRSSPERRRVGAVRLPRSTAEGATIGGCVGHGFRKSMACRSHVRSRRRRASKISFVRRSFSDYLLVRPGRTPPSTSACQTVGQYGAELRGQRDEPDEGREAAADSVSSSSSFIRS